MVDRQWLRDSIERVAWTAIQGAATAAVIVLGDLDVVWAPVLVAAFSAVKALAARRIGDPQSASTLRR